MKKIIISLWKYSQQGSNVQVSYAGPNLYLFSIDSDSARDWVLENDPWYIYNKPLILRQWEPNLKKLHFDLTKISIWVHLYNVPLELFTNDGLSYIASAIGFPLSMNSVTTTKTRLEFSKVCVEIGVSDVIPKFIDVVLNNGQETSILVEIPWLPPCCKHCNSFGNSSKNYKNNPNSSHTTQVWRKKDPSTSDSSGNNNLASSNEVDSVSVKENVAGNFIPPPLPITTSYYTFPVEDTYPSSLPSSMEIENDLACVSTTEPDSNKGSKSPIKKSRARPPKGKLAKSLADSSNRFEILLVEETTQASETMGKQPRVAASGVTELLKDLKSKKKSHLDKVKSLSVKGLDITLCYALAQTITIECSFNNSKFLLTGIYGHNDGVARRSLWQDLRLIESRYYNHPWILGGDFNVTMYPQESSNHEQLGLFFFSSEMIDFQEVSHELHLQDHPYFGPTFSWSNKQTENFLARKLDRFLINPLWFEFFNHSFAEFLAPGSSDHYLALVNLNKEIHLNKPKPFKFFNCWTLHHNFLNIVSQYWYPPYQENPMKKLFLKLKRLKSNLKQLNKESFSDISARVREKQE
ncbi:uncharacterized protein LOC120172630 [Hibiscus syriacus]|uniref:uncharacterized protein LOC120172630 n=1 Tax=Hibiscus syriacus TaxID=106335 RepID=UPI001920EF48|nr:uncharacterized protein LOC120172630 [Hibiscus syriacus]